MKEIKKIRIGNDIRLAVDLGQYIVNNYNSQYLRERKVYNPNNTDFENIDSNDFVNKSYELYYPNEYSFKDNDGEEKYIDFKPTNIPISIRSIRAYLINTSKEGLQKRYMRRDFISRYPIEPYCNVFDSNAYDICGCGIPTWHARPFPHRIVPYNGFGLNPNWDGIYKTHRKIEEFKYCAPVCATSKQNVVEIIFPAQAQKHIGKYKLIVVAKVYAPGFNEANLKTITVDMDNVFELVGSTEEGIDTGISMDVNIVQDILQGKNESDNPGITHEDKYLNNAEFNEDYNTIELDMSDGEHMTVDLDNRLGWYYDETM